MPSFELMVDIVVATRMVKVDWGRQAIYCRLQAKIGTCINVDLQLKGQRVITG